LKTSIQYQFGKRISSSDYHSQPVHFCYGVRKLWTHWTSPPGQKIRWNKWKFMAASDSQEEVW